MPKKINHIICNTVEQAWFGLYWQEINISAKSLRLWYGMQVNGKTLLSHLLFGHAVSVLADICRHLGHYRINALSISRSICWLQGDIVFLSHTESSKSHTVAYYCWRSEDSPAFSARAGGLKQVRLAFIQSTTEKKMWTGRKCFPQCKCNRCWIGHLESWFHWKHYWREAKINDGRLSLSKHSGWDDLRTCWFM